MAQELFLGIKLGVSGTAAIGAALGSAKNAMARREAVCEAAGFGEAVKDIAIVDELSRNEEAKLGASLRRVALTFSQAANNFRNFLAKLTSPDTVRTLKNSASTCKAQAAPGAPGDSPATAGIDPDTGCAGGVGLCVLGAPTSAPLLHRLPHGADGCKGMGEWLASISA